MRCHPRAFFFFFNFFLPVLQPSTYFDQLLPFSFYFLPVYICLHLFFSTSSLPPISSDFPTSSFLYSGHLLPILLFFRRHFQHVQLLCHRQAQTPRFWPPFNRHAAYRPIQTALIGSDSKYVPWNWLGMHVHECVCVPVCVCVCVCVHLHVCGAAREKRGLLLWGKQNKKESVTKI